MSKGDVGPIPSHPHHIQLMKGIAVGKRRHLPLLHGDAVALHVRLFVVILRRRLLTWIYTEHRVERALPIPLGLEVGSLWRGYLRLIWQHGRGGVVDGPSWTMSVGKASTCITLQIKLHLYSLERCHFHLPTDWICICIRPPPTRSSALHPPPNGCYATKYMYAPAAACYVMTPPDATPILLAVTIISNLDSCR